MEIQSETNKPEKKKQLRRSSNRISFSAKLPGDVRGVFTECLCAVTYSTDPLSDMKQSIAEMMKSMSVSDWEELEELIYCYISLNSEEVHTFIEEAFLSICCSTDALSSLLLLK